MNVGLGATSYRSDLWYMGNIGDGTTHIAETLYVDAASLAASTSHLTKFTLGYCFASASNAGAMA